MTNSPLTASIERIDTVSTHRLNEPTYPKTVIIPLNNNDYTIQYAHERPLSSFTVDDCPDSVFNYNNSYYQSLLSMKQSFIQNLEKLNKQLEAFDETARENFINEHIDEKYLSYTNKIQKNITKLSSTTAEDIIRDISNGSIDITERDITELSDEIMSDLSEFHSALESVDEFVYEELNNKWFTQHGIAPSSEQYIKNMKSQWEAYIANVDMEIIEWKKVALADAVEYENKCIKEYQSIPKTCRDFKTQLQRMYRQNVSLSTQDVKNSVLDIVKTKLHATAIKKYDNQLNTLIMLHNKCKCYRYIEQYMSAVNEKLSTMLNTLNLKSFKDANWYELKQLIFPMVNKQIMNQTQTLFREIEERLSLIQPFGDIVSNMQMMKRIITNLIAAMNDALIDMPTAIEDNVTDESFEGLIELVDSVNEKYSGEKQSEKLVNDATNE